MYGDIANVFFSMMFVIAMPMLLFYYKGVRTSETDRENFNWNLSFLFAGGFIVCAIETIIFKILGDV